MLIISLCFQAFLYAGAHTAVLRPLILTVGFVKACVLFMKNTVDAQSTTLRNVRARDGYALVEQARFLLPPLLPAGFRRQ